MYVKTAATGLLENGADAVKVILPHVLVAQGAVIKLGHPLPSFPITAAMFHTLHNIVARE